MRPLYIGLRLGRKRGLQKMARGFRQDETKEEQWSMLSHDGVITETEKALLISFDEDRGIEKWVPKSVSFIDDANNLWIKSWFVDKEGLEDYVEETEVM